MKSRLAGTLTILRTLPGQRRVPFLPAEQVAELRDRRVRETVRHAAETVPHYRELFRREGIDPRQIRSAGDLDRLPLLDRATVHAAPDRFRSTSRDTQEAISLRTSGMSTGFPLDIYHDRASLLANIAYSERERAVEAHFCGRRVRYTAAELRYAPATVKAVRAFYDRSAFRPFRPRHHDVAIEARLETIVATLNRLRPEVIRGYGNYLELLFRLAVARRIVLHRPKVLVFAGEGMTPEGRSFVETELGIVAISRYNAVEAFKIGFFCEQRSGFHLHEDLCHVSVVGPDGGAVQPGESGEVVISNLVNRATVLLNYRLGDLARMTLEPCPCGRTSRRLTELEGRVGEIIHLQSGEVVPQSTVWGVLKVVDGVIRYQLVQRERASFELKLMTVDRATFDLLAGDVTGRMRDLLQGASLEVVYAEAIDLDGRGKFRPVIPLDAP
jgi:phenylacetate-CoA ligase